MTASTTTLERVFRFGTTTLPDPDPQASPEDALKMYEPNFPHLKNAVLGTPTPEGSRMVYPVEKPPVKTKG